MAASGWKSGERESVSLAYFVYAFFSNLLENSIASETWLGRYKHGKDNVCVYASEDRAVIASYILDSVDEF